MIDEDFDDEVFPESEETDENSRMGELIREAYSQVQDTESDLIRLRDDLDVILVSYEEPHNFPPSSDAVGYAWVDIDSIIAGLEIARDALDQYGDFLAELNAGPEDSIIQEGE